MFIAIDLGATFIKAALVDTGRLTLHHVARSPFPAFIKDPDSRRREVEPDGVVQQVRAHLLRLLRETDRCSGIVFSSQMHGFVLADRRGNALSPFISWQDQRCLSVDPSGSGTYFDQLRMRISEDEIGALGREMRPGFPVTNLFYLAQTAALPRDAIPCALPDFVIARLTGSDPCCEPTLASSFGTLDLARGRWHERVLEKLGLRTLHWPGLVDFRQATGFYEHQGRKIPVYAGVGDHQAALLGSFLREGELSINISTGSQVSLLSRTLDPGEHQMRPYFGNRYLKTVTHIPAGRALNALIALFSELARRGEPDLGDAFEYIEQAAGAVQAAGLCVDTAFFPSACGDHGSITGMQEGNMTVGHVFRAALENMADNYRRMAIRIAPDLAFERVVFSGGLAVKSSLLRGLVADRFARPVRVCTVSEDVLLGLLCLSLVHAGRCATVEEGVELLARQDAAGHVWCPDPRRSE